MKETLEAKVINGNITLTIPEKPVDSEIIEIQKRDKELVERMEGSPGSLDSYVKKYSNDDNNVNEIIGGLYTWIKNTKLGKLIKYLHTEAPFPVRALTYGTEIFVGGAVLGGCSGTVIPEPPPPGPVQTIDIPANYDHEFTKIILTPDYGYNNKIIELWDKDPAVWIGDNASQDYINKAKKAVGKLAKFTDYVITPYIVDNKELADITFEWVDNLEDLPLGGVANASITEVNGEYVIKKAKILFWNGLVSYLVEGTCLEELTQVLGVLGDTQIYPESVFAINNAYTEYCSQDLAAGKVIYQLEPGTTFAEFDEIVTESLKIYSFLDGF